MTENNTNAKGQSWVIDRTAISPYKDFCDGYMATGATGNGYISVLKVETGTCKKTDDPLLDTIVSYDTAESNGAYIGQINMITASSFSGVAGQIWGLDLACHDLIVDNKWQSSFVVKNFDGTDMIVYDAFPLLEAGKSLFGSAQKRRYPLVPGAHTICANKNVSAYRPDAGQPLKEGEAYGVWSAISISIAHDRTKGANLFVEDGGLWTKNDNLNDMLTWLGQVKRREIANCSLACGKNAGVAFDRSYVGFAATIMQPGEMGQAVTVGPYVSIAQKGVPDAGFGQLNKMRLSEWEKMNGFEVSLSV